MPIENRTAGEIMLIAAITLATVLTGSSAPLHHSALATGLHQVHGSASVTKVVMNRPRQLALDPQGNIYVASSGTNAILVYDPAYVQQTNRTIANMKGPTGVALDPYGNIFAVNSGANQVVEFSPTGVPETVFSTGLINPDSLAVDALDDVYVVNNTYSSLSVFQKNGALAHSYRDGQPYGSMTAVAINGPTLLSGQSNSHFGNGTASVVQSWDADSMLTANIVQHQNGYLQTGSFITDMKVDASGAVWAVDGQSNRIHYQPVPGALFSVFKILNYTPGGIAVDSVRGLLYVSDINGGSIHVYNFQAQHVATFM